MHNLKKVVAVIAVLAMVLGTMVTGFAATVTLGLTPAADIKGTDYADAAARLQALGVMIGYPDGSFKPTNPVTRTEFATTVDRALGLDSAAQLAGGTKPAFKDVNADYQWAWGYINTAVSNSIVNGYPDGTFKPGNQVTFAEAATMLVRALGYDPAVTGVWPTNYLSKAAEIGILDGVKATADGAATRGDVALMVDNALDIKMMERSTYGDTAEYKVGTKTLLTDKLNILRIDGRVVSSPAVNSSLKGEVTIQPSDKDLKKVTYDVADTINPDTILGLDVIAWAKIDKNDTQDNIFYVEYEDSQVKHDAISDVDAKADKVELVVADDTYKISDDSVIYLDGEKADIDDLAKAFDDGDGATIYGSFVFDNDDIVSANLQQFAKFDDQVVTKVDKDNELITTFDETGVQDEIDLTDPDDYVITDAVGNTVKLEDIKANDVVYVADYDDTYHVVVVSNAVTGKLGTVKSGSLKLDDTSYDVSTKATYSLNKDSDIDTYKDGYNDTKGDIKDAIGENVTALLDLKGQVRHLTSEVDVSTSNYGLVSMVDAYSDKIKMYDSVQDKNVSYDFDGDIHLDTAIGTVTPATDKTIKIAQLRTLTGADADQYVAVKYVLDKDNVISDIYVLGVITDEGVIGDTANSVSEGLTAEVKTVDTVDSFNEDHDWIKIGSDYFYMSSSTPILGLDDGDAEAAKWDDIKDKDLDKGSDLLIVTDKKDDVKFLVIATGYGDISSSDENLGVVLSKYFDADGARAAKIAVWDGETKEYKLASNSVNKGDVINFEFNKDSKVDKVAKITTLPTAEIVTSKDSSSLTTEDTTYKINSDTLFFDATDGFTSIDTAKLSDVKKGDSVQIVKEGKLAKLVFLVSEDTGTGTGTGTAGTVTYINDKDGRFAIGNEAYKVDADTKLYDANGNIAQIGIADLLAAIDGKEVTEIKLDNDGFVTSLRLAGTEAELSTLLWNKTAISPIADANPVGVPHSTKTVPTVSATATEKYATVKITQATKMDGSADAVATVKVTSEDGKIDKTYTVTFTAAAAGTDTTLKSISVGGTSYTVAPSIAVKLPTGSTEPLEVKAVATDANATVKITDATDVTTADGVKNVTTITVTAEDGTTTDTYKVVFTVE